MHKQRRKILAALLTVAMLASILPIGAAPAFAASGTYLEYSWDEQTKTLTPENKSLPTSYTTVQNTTTTWDGSTNGGWYIAEGAVKIDSAVTVSGDVKLILADSCTLTVNGGINVPSGSKLSIYAQSEGNTMGKLTTTGTTINSGGTAGIGGTNTNVSFGTITIHGGTIVPTGGLRAAGIGGGGNLENTTTLTGTITIYGGRVTATGGQYAAGIGGGREGSTNDSKVNIYGGTITAEGNSGAGIGGGYYDANGATGGSININGGTIEAKGGQHSAGIGGGNLGNVTAITISGGNIEATSGVGGAGIGGGQNSTGSGTITISGGEITAKGSQGNQHFYASGIGGGFKNAGGTIIITGGNISASGGASGIGGGEKASGGTIIISGGVVKAESVNGGSGIGDGVDITAETAKGTFFTTYENQPGHAIITASSISDTSKSGEWSGLFITKDKNTAKIYGSDDFSVSQDLEIPTGYYLTIGEGQTLTIDQGANLTVNGTLIKNGTLTFANGATLDGEGGIEPGLPQSTAPSAPTQNGEATTKSITLQAITGGVNGVEYACVERADAQAPAADSGEWKASTEFSGLAPGTAYTFYARYAGNDFYEPSDPCSMGTTIYTLPDITTTALADGTVGVAYSQQLEATSDETVTWSAEGLPDGLTLSGNTISGTPTTAGEYTVTITATIDGGVKNSETYTLTIGKGQPAFNNVTVGGGDDNNTFTYGDTITISGKISASQQQTNSLTQNQVGLYLDGGEEAIATAAVQNDGSFTLSYDTEQEDIPVGEQTLTLKYGGSGDLESGETSVTITLNKADQDPPTGDTGYTINYAAETISAEGGYELATTNEADEGSATLDLTPGSDAYIRVKGDDFHTPSAWTTVDIKDRPSTPDAPKIVAKSGNSLTVAVEEGREYKLADRDWQKVENDRLTFEDLEPNTEYTIYTRTPAVAGASFASNPASVTATTLGENGSGPVADGETATLPDGTTVTNDGDKITITPPPESGKPTTSISPVPETGEATIDQNGNIQAPAGSTVTTGDTEITIGDQGGSISPEGIITLPAGGSATVTDENGDKTTVTAPESGTTTIKPNEDGGLTISGGATVETPDGDKVTLPAEGGTITPDGNLTYGVTVTFDSQGGTAVPAQENIPVGDKATEPDRPSKGDNTFTGWYTDPDCTERWDFSNPVMSDITLYAGWQPYTGRYSYEVTTDIGDNGALTVDRYATEGDTVTIQVTPDQAYKLDDLSVTAGGKEVEVTANSDGTYTFTMPSADVKITATFAEDPDWTEPEPEPEPSTDVSDLFIDIAPNAWYKDAVQYAYDNGLMTGVSATEFAPEQTTTRAMIVSILARLEGVTTAQAAGFADVDDNDWYATAVNWAANVGVVNGYEDNTFRPNTAITREQLAAILMNYAAYKGEDVSARAALDNYTDQPSTWATETMSWAVAEGLISGVTNDELQPQGNATRAQVAAILQRFLDK